jgi:molybdopterin molybdotransferase
MQEDTRISPDRLDEVLVGDTVSVGESVRRVGEDVRRGDVIGGFGEELTPGSLALLAATGIGEVVVGRQPAVGLLATGSELREAGQPLAPGQIYESNRTMLRPLVSRAGGRPVVFPLVPDTLPATQAALEQALAECDLVVTSGGVSVGEMDFVKAAFEKLGGGMQFWQVAIRPGKPFVFGRLGNKFLFGLPGNPVSAFVTFLLLVRPALRRWQGAADVGLRTHPAVLAERFVNRGDRRHWLRVRVSPEGRVASAGRQASHALGSLAAANGLLELGAGEELPVGANVNVLRWE